MQRQRRGHGASSWFKGKWGQRHNQTAVVVSKEQAASPVWEGVTLSHVGARLRAGRKLEFELNGAKLAQRTADCRGKDACTTPT